MGYRRRAASRSVVGSCRTVLANSTPSGIHWQMLPQELRCGSGDDVLAARARLQQHPWLNQFRRLAVRFDKLADIHEAFPSLGCADLLIAAQDVELADAPFSGRSPGRQVCSCPDRPV
jgi:hypothetical protein